MDSPLDKSFLPRGLCHEELYKSHFNIIKSLRLYKVIKSTVWGLGVGDWGLGIIGDWGLGIGDWEIMKD